MNEPLQIEGRWWILGSGHPAYYGVLHFEPQGRMFLHIKSAGRQPAIKLVSSDLLRRIPSVIHGKDASNQNISLFGTCPMHQKGSVGFIEIEIDVLRALLGIKLRTWNDKRFSRVRVKLSLLHDWTGRAGVSIDWRAKAVNISVPHEIVITT